MKNTQRTILLTALLMASATGAAAQEDKFVKHLSDRVAVGSKTRYSDLVKLLFRDFSAGEQEATATKTIPLRHVSRDHDKMPLTGDFRINTLDTVRIRDSGGPIVIVELDIEIDNDSDFVYAGRASILAAFRVSPKPSGPLGLPQPRLQHGYCGRC